MNPRIDERGRVPFGKGSIEEPSCAKIVRLVDGRGLTLDTFPFYRDVPQSRVRDSQTEWKEQISSTRDES